MKRAGLFCPVAALTLASFGGCVGYSEGIQVAIRIRPSPDGALHDVALGDGSTMHVDGLVLSIEAAELVRCGESGGHHHHADRARGRAIEGLAAVLFPSASAQHEHGSPLVVNGPFLIDLVGEDSVTLPELFSPAPGCYDRVILALSELSLGAHHGGRYLSSHTTAVIAANAPLEAPVEIGAGVPVELEVTLARARPFALLDSVTTELEGDRVLAGIAAQTEARALE